MPYKKTIKRIARKTYRKLKPYASKKKGYSNRMKLYKEVNQIKKMMNAEKKVKENSLFGQGVGQSNGILDGAYCSSIMPTISQGNGYDARNGRSIKLSGAYIRGKFQAQSSTINKIKFNVTIVKSIGIPQTTTQVLNGLYNVDSISGLRDYFAPRNPDSFTDYRIICSRNYLLYPDSISGQTGIIDYMMPLKLNHHVRYSLNTTTIEEGELFVIVRADSGDQATSTGAFFSMAIRFTYYDN